MIGADMKITSVLVGLTLSALPAAAQTPAAAMPQGYGSAQPQTMTLSGCVSSINNSPNAFALSNAAIVPTSAQPGTATNVPAPTPVGTPATQPPAVAVPPTAPVPPATPPVTTPATPPVSPPARPPVNPPATPPPNVAAPPPNPATSGVTTAPPATAGINAAPPTTGINTASQAAANTAGYRLSGLNFGSFSGQRVQVVGVIVPAAAPAGGAVGTSGTTGQTLPEFRVQSVQPIGGDCPQQ